MFSKRTPAAYGVIGLGRFGSALAKTLSEAGKDVLVLDKDESKVQELRRYTEHALVVQDLTRETLEDAGIQNCDVVIVCIGERIDTSILATLNVVNLGVPTVIAKATSRDQGCVLEKIGAQVVYPEHDMAVRLAKKLLSNSVLDYISLSNDIEISELRITDKLVGQSILQTDLRRRHGLNIIAIEHEKTTTTEIDPHYVFQAQDVIVVIGQKDRVRKFERFLLGER